MGEKRFLTVQVDYHKVQVPVDDIMYVTVDGRKTKLSLLDGSNIRTNRALKDIYAELPEEVFTRINRGVVVSKHYVTEEQDGILTMRDGAQLKRRVRSDRLTREVPAGRNEKRKECPVEELNWWLGELPVPVCVMEMVYRQQGGSLRPSDNAVQEASYEHPNIIPIRGLHGQMPVLGFRFGDIAYITDMSELPEGEFAKLQGLKHLTLNTVSYKPHHSHFSLDEALSLADRIGAENTWLTHLSHTFPRHEKFCAELREICAERKINSIVQPAYDGLTITA